MLAKVDDLVNYMRKGSIWQVQCTPIMTEPKKTFYNPLSLNVPAIRMALAAGSILHHTGAFRAWGWGIPRRPSST